MTPFDNPLWDPKALHEYFLRLATEKERYLIEVKSKVPRSKLYEAIYDQTLAEFYIYNFFHGRTYLDSRETFLHALGELEVSSVLTADYFDRTRFVERRLGVIRELHRIGTNRF